jgi:hypothetical protein
LDCSTIFKVVSRVSSADSRIASLPILKEVVEVGARDLAPLGGDFARLARLAR